MAKEGIEWDMSSDYSPLIYHCRNDILHGDPTKGKKQIPWQGRFKYDWQIWIDSDMIWTPEDIKRLISRNNLSIISGCYMRQDDNNYAFSIREMDGSFKAMTRQEVDPMGDPFEVSVTGFGFVAIKYGVVESMEYPWFRPLVKEDEESFTFTSEDTGFCMLAQQAGYVVVVDPSIQVGHEKSWILRPEIVGGHSPV